MSQPSAAQRKTAARSFRERVKLFRPTHWPVGAPPPEVIIEAGATLLADVERRTLPTTLRSLDRLTITANRRLSLSLKEQKPGSAVLRCHWVLLQDHRLAAEAAHALHSGRFGSMMQSVIDDAAGRVTPDACYAETRSSKIITRGEWLDLSRVYQSIVHHLPDAEAATGVRITWGSYAAPARRRRRSIKLGSMVERERLIRIHPALDNPWVPRHVLDFVVYHELCHWVAPPLSAAEARATRQHRVHHAAFRELERRFPKMNEAQQWIDENIDRLLRAGNAR